MNFDVTLFDKIKHIEEGLQGLTYISGEIYEKTSDLYTSEADLENNVKVPWDDLRYIFGEIMYGGHIVEDWDRRLANAYLYKFFNE